MLLMARPSRPEDAVSLVKEEESLLGRFNRLVGDCHASDADGI